MPGSVDFVELLEVLSEAGIDFVLVGGVAAILAGAPISTFDLDIVIRQEAGNRARLLDALRQLDARYLDPGGRRIRPDLAKLETMRLHRLETRCGVLDLMTTVGPGWTFADLLSRSAEIQLSDLTIRVIELAALIEAKEAADREKDRAVLPLLRRTLALRGEGG